MYCLQLPRVCYREKEYLKVVQLLHRRVRWAQLVNQGTRVKLQKMQPQNQHNVQGEKLDLQSQEPFKYHKDCPLLGLPAKGRHSTAALWLCPETWQPGKAHHSFRARQGAELHKLTAIALVLGTNNWIPQKVSLSEHNPRPDLLCSHYLDFFLPSVLLRGDNVSFQKWIIS